MCVAKASGVLAIVTWGVPSQRCAGRSVTTAGRPAARYSSVFSGKLAWLNADWRYGVSPTSTIPRYDGSSSKGLGPTHCTFGRARSASSFAIANVGDRGPTSSSDAPVAATASSIARSIRSDMWPTKPAIGPGSVTSAGTGARSAVPRCSAMHPFGTRCVSGRWAPHLRRSTGETAMTTSALASCRRSSRSSQRASVPVRAAPAT